jgi:hypothetical protein
VKFNRPREAMEHGSLYSDTVASNMWCKVFRLLIFYKECRDDAEGEIISLKGQINKLLVELFCDYLR